MTDLSLTHWQGVLVWTLLAGGLLGFARPAVAGTGRAVWPGKTWATRPATEAGMDEAKLKAFSDFAKGRGCVTRRGFLVYTWGDHARRGDVASACKPWFSHFLFKAVEDGKIKGLDEKAIKWEPRLGKINAGLGHKDRRITWRHLATQTSCYQVTDEPGKAFCYNDWQMALFWDTLFLKVYGATLKTVDAKVVRPLLTDVLQCQDRPTFMAFGTRDRPGRVAVSPRDFCRFGLLYLRKGKWKDKRLLSEKHAVMAVTSPLPASLPRAGRKLAEMIPGQRTMGSGARPDNQCPHQGSYSFLWWISGTDAKGSRLWPGVPEDAYGAFGHGGPRAMVVVPSLDLVFSWNDARLRGWERVGKAIKLACDAVVDRPATAAQKPKPPYPPSPVIKEVKFDFTSRIRRAPGSDNWAITWADDGHQYAVWGDGGGFGGTNSRGRVSLGVARVEGAAEKHKGVNVYGGVGGRKPGFGGKSYGIVCIKGVLYMWVGPGSGVASFKEARLHKSTDHGASWTRADWAFTQADGMVMPAICTFGKDYTGARDEYVYSYFIRLRGRPQRLDVNAPGAIDLVRAPAGKIMDRNAYQFFAGLNAAGQSKWNRDLTARRPVFEDRRGVGWVCSVSYNAGLKRYVLCTEHDKTCRGNLGIFDAAEPWGPWTTVGSYSNWGKFGSTFYWNFSNKWLSADGRKFTLIFTGTGRNDAWNTVRGEFVVAEGSGRGEPKGKRR